MAHILIVGKAFSGIKDYLTAHGHTWTLLQDESATKYPERKSRGRMVVNMLDEQAIFDAVDKIHTSTPIEATLVTYEAYIIANALISARLDLPGLSLEAARACTDKELMRELFSHASQKISPDFAVVTSHESLMRFAKEHDFPLILKPANLSKSLLVTKNYSIDELIYNYEKALGLIASTYKKYAPGRTPKLLVEEFLEGHIHSVDAFVDIHGNPHVLENVVDYQTGYDVGYEDNFHYSRILPSQLPPDEIQAIRATAAEGCRALGMSSSAAHIEVIYTQDGPRIVEIGARNGGYRERMHWLANGIDITGNALALATNQTLNLLPKSNDSVGVFELFPKQPGLFQGVLNEAELRSLPSLNYFSVKAKPGQFVGKSSDGYKMCAVVILHNKDRAQFNKDHAFLNENLRVATIQPDATSY